MSRGNPPTESPTAFVPVENDTGIKKITSASSVRPRPVLKPVLPVACVWIKRAVPSSRIWRPVWAVVHACWRVPSKESHFNRGNIGRASAMPAGTRKYRPACGPVRAAPWFMPMGNDLPLKNASALSKN